MDLTQKLLRQVFFVHLHAVSYLMLGPGLFLVKGVANGFIGSRQRWNMMFGFVVSSSCSLGLSKLGSIKGVLGLHHV